MNHLRVTERRAASGRLGPPGAPSGMACVLPLEAATGGGVAGVEAAPTRVQTDAHPTDGKARSSQLRAGPRASRRTVRLPASLSRLDWAEVPQPQNVPEHRSLRGGVCRSTPADAATGNKPCGLGRLLRPDPVTGKRSRDP